MAATRPRSITFRLHQGGRPHMAFLVDGTPRPHGGAGSCRARRRRPAWWRTRGSVERLKVLIRWGCNLCACQMRWTVRSDRFMALAMARPVQCVTAPGGSRRVRSTTAWTLALRDGRCAGRTGLVAQEAFKALLGVTLLPAPHHWPTDADPFGDLHHRQTVSREQHDLRPLQRASRVDPGPR